MRLSVPCLRRPDQPSPAAGVYSTLSLPGLDLWVSETCADADRPDWQKSNVSSWMRSDHYRYVMRCTSDAKRALGQFATVLA